MLLFGSKIITDRNQGIIFDIINNNNGATVVFYYQVLTLFSILYSAPDKFEKMTTACFSDQNTKARDIRKTLTPTPNTM